MNEEKTYFDALAGREPEVQLAAVKADLKSRAIAPKLEAAPEEEDDIDAENFNEGEGQLTVDVYQTADDIVVQSTIAGVDPNSVEIAINNEMVTIRGKREKMETIDAKDYFYQELYWGKFSRSIVLPQEIDSDRAAAELKNGILTVRLPKIRKQKIKKLKIKTE